MSADTTPISPSRFAGALKDLSIGMLHLKVLEIRNSIAHLQYSNDQLQPFAEGSSTASDAEAPGEPDQDCIDAICENEQVIDRMAERLVIIRAEVEDRGVSWTEFQIKDESEGKADKVGASAAKVNGETHGLAATDESEQPSTTRHAAWTDGTFQTGTIRGGQVQIGSQPGAQGGRLNDEQLRAAVEEQLRHLTTDDGGDDDDDGGLYL